MKSSLSNSRHDQTPSLFETAALVEEIFPVNREGKKERALRSAAQPPKHPTAQTIAAPANEPESFDELCARLGAQLGRVTFASGWVQAVFVNDEGVYTAATQALAFEDESGAWRDPDEYMQTNGQAGLLGMLAECAPHQIRRHHDSETWTLADVTEWFAEHFRPCEIPPEYVKPSMPAPMLAPHREFRGGDLRTVTPDVYSIGAVTIPAHELIEILACVLNKHAGLFIAATAAERDATDPWADARCAEVAELMAAARAIEKMMDEGAIWRIDYSLPLPGLAGARSLTAEGFLAHVGVSLLWLCQRVAETAHDSMPAREALEVVEACVVIEQLADSQGVKTGRTHDGPTRLQKLEAQTRWAAFVPHAA